MLFHQHSCADCMPINKVLYNIGHILKIFQSESLLPFLFYINLDVQDITGSLSIQELPYCMSQICPQVDNYPNSCRLPRRRWLHKICATSPVLNIVKPRQIGGHFSDVIFILFFGWQFVLYWLKVSKIAFQVSITNQVTLFWIPTRLRRVLPPMYFAVTLTYSFDYFHLI